MRTYEQLTQILTQIKSNDYEIPDDVNIDELISDMLNYIGDTDGELRDKLIYSAFNQWSYKTLTQAQIRHILFTCIGEQYLFKGIGESGTDTVFTRAFSSLPISLAFCMHDDTPFLTVDEINNVKNTVMRYAAEERDYRGYVDGKGWAHAIAHLADALANIFGVDKAVDIESEYSASREDLEKGLGVIKMLVCNKEYVYTAEEDERLIPVFFSICSNEMFTTSEIIAWLDSFNMEDKEWWSGAVPDSFNLHLNRKTFMRSLYFQLLECKDDEFDEISVREIDKHVLSFLVE